MVLIDIDKGQREVINAKENEGIPISKTLKRLGIPGRTYYKKIDNNGEARWRDISEGKMLIKINKGMSRRGLDKVKENPQKFGGLSGGSMSDTDQKEDKFFQGIALKMQQCENHRKKYDAEYIDD